MATATEQLRMQHAEHQKHRSLVDTAKRLVVPLAAIAGIGGAAGTAAVLGGPIIRSAIIDAQRASVSLEPYWQETVSDGSVDVCTSPDNNNLSAAYKEEDVLGIGIHYVNFFMGDWHKSDHVFQAMRDASANGIRPILSWGQPGDLFENFVSSREDMREFARYIRDLGFTIYFRPFFEMNGEWFSYGKNDLTPDQFTRGWIRLVTLFRDEGASNVKWVWSPNSTINADDFVRYYPGRAYVDIVSLDVYEKSTTNPSLWKRYVFYPHVSPEALLGPDLVTLRRLAGDEEDVWISELGYGREEGAESWMPRAVRFAAHMGVHVICIFTWNQTGKGWDEVDWRIIGGSVLASSLTAEFDHPEYNDELIVVRSNEPRPTELPTYKNPTLSFGRDNPLPKPIRNLLPPKGVLYINPPTRHKARLAA